MTLSPATPDEPAQAASRLESALELCPDRLTLAAQALFQGGEEQHRLAVELLQLAERLRSAPAA